MNFNVRPDTPIMRRGQFSPRLPPPYFTRETPYSFIRDNVLYNATNLEIQLENEGNVLKIAMLIQSVYTITRLGYRSRQLSRRLIKYLGGIWICRWQCITHYDLIVFWCSFGTLLLRKRIMVHVTLIVYHVLCAWTWTPV